MENRLFDDLLNLIKESLKERFEDSKKYIINFIKDVVLNYTRKGIVNFNLYQNMIQGYITDIKINIKYGVISITNLSIIK